MAGALRARIMMALLTPLAVHEHVDGVGDAVVVAVEGGVLGGGFDGVDGVAHGDGAASASEHG